MLVDAKPCITPAGISQILIEISLNNNNSQTSLNKPVEYTNLYNFSLATVESLLS